MYCISGSIRRVSFSSITPVNRLTPPNAGEAWNIPTASSRFFQRYGSPPARITRSNR